MHDKVLILSFVPFFRILNFDSVETADAHLVKWGKFHFFEVVLGGTGAVDGHKLRLIYPNIRKLFDTF